MRKKVIILEHGGGELSNQLWNFISVYAYCREKEYLCENYSFFEYAPWFRVSTCNPFIYTLFFLPFQILKKLGGYRTMAASPTFRLLKKTMRSVYRLYTRYIRMRHKEQVVFAEQNVIRLDSAEPNALETVLKHKPVVYCAGWLFRNSRGIEKHRPAIKEYLKPKQEYLDKTAEFISQCRKQYKHLVGVHIRQRNSWDTALSGAEDIASWSNYDAKPFFYPAHFGFINKFIKEYCRISHLNLAETGFVICSNKLIDEHDFPELHCLARRGTLIEDILALASCDCIIGSNSTLSAFVSWWGEVPLIVFQEHPDWEYYQDKHGYFENKHLTAVHF